MAEANAFNAVIKAVDEATAPIRAIVAHVRGLTQEVDKTNKAVAKVEHRRTFEALTGHVQLLHSHFGRLNATIGEVGHSITEFLPMLGALGAAGSLVGLFELTEHVSEMRSELVKMSKEIGIVPEQLMALNMAAKLTDVSVESMDKGLVKLDKSIALAAAGKNKDALALFQHLHIGLRDSAAHLRTVSDLMPALADAFRNTSDPAMRVRMAMALFGKAGADMIPMLMEGSEALREFAKVSKEVNYLPSREEAEGMEQFHQGWIKLQAAAAGFSNAIGAKLAPVLAPVLTLVTGWITANRDWIATKIADKVKELAHWVEQLNLKEIIDQTREWVTAIGHAAEHTGGWTTVLGAAALALGSPLIIAVTGAITILGALGGVLQTLTVLAWANPIIAAAALVGLAAYEIYEHWAWVKEKITAVFTWFSGQTGWVQDLLMAIAPFIFVPAKIYEHWEPISAFFTTLWTDIGAAFDTGWAYVKPIVDQLKAAAGWVADSWLGRTISGITGPSQSVQGGAASGPSAGPNYDQAMPMPRLYGDGGAGSASAASAGTPQNGEVRVKVDIANLPPGSKVDTSSTGIATPPETNVGYALPAFAF